MRTLAPSKNLWSDCSVPLWHRERAADLRHANNVAEAARLETNIGSRASVDNREKRESKRRDLAF
jgi:hypothetical protein